MLPTDMLLKRTLYIKQRSERSDLLPDQRLHERRRAAEVGNEIPVYKMGEEHYVERIHQPGLLRRQGSALEKLNRWLTKESQPVSPQHLRQKTEYREVRLDSLRS